MARLRAEANQIIDTSEHTVHTLRKHLLDRFSLDRKAGRCGLRCSVSVISLQSGDLELLFDGVT